MPPLAAMSKQAFTTPFQTQTCIPWAAHPELTYDCKQTNEAELPNHWLAINNRTLTAEIHYLLWVSVVYNAPSPKCASRQLHNYRSKLWITYDSFHTLLNTRNSSLEHQTCRIDFIHCSRKEIRAALNHQYPRFTPHHPQCRLYRYWASRCSTIRPSSLINITLRSHSNALSSFRKVLSLECPSS